MIRLSAAVRAANAPFHLRPLALCVAALGFSHPAASVAADDPPRAEAPTVVITGLRRGDPWSTDVGANELARARARTSDTAALLSDVPGMSLYTAGGVSSLPSLHGLADDRLRIKVDGMDTVASCPNHMNSALSYIDPTAVGSIKVYAGLAPVSVGGDSIGGAIVVEPAAPVFAGAGQPRLLKGSIGGFYRSNGHAQGVNAAATFATDSLSMTYTGAVAQSDNLRAGGAFKRFSMAGVAPTVPADVVGSTAYESRNHTLGLALRADRHLIEARLGLQDIPYELYPNQRMDMLGNTAHRFSLRYQGQFDWGALDARAYRERVSHFMDFGPDKLYSYGSVADLKTPSIRYPVNGMPMYTRGRTLGGSIKAGIELSERDLLRVGAEVQQYGLDDWWPPAPDCGVGNCTGGMAPYTFWNITDGRRDRSAAYAEWEARWNPLWLSIVGLRAERVVTDTGPVQGYNATMYTKSSVGTTAAFNALDRRRSDSNFDFTALARHTPNVNTTVEFGLAQKSRSPNLYERYTWSAAGMAMEMNNFVGDGNGYLGQPNLRPEVARTLGLSFDWHSADGQKGFRVSPFYTRVTDFIDAVRLPSTTNMMGVSDSNATVTNNFVKLQYANQSARLYGVDLSAQWPLASTSYGQWSAKGLLNSTHGTNLDTGGGLYNIMPLNLKLTLQHRLGGWDNGIELAGVSSKSRVSDARNEIKTPGYGLVNLRASHTWSRWRIDFGVENLFDRLYLQPLGGAYTGQGATMSFGKEVGNVASGMSGTSGSASAWGTGVAGTGRSVFVSLKADF